VWVHVKHLKSPRKIWKELGKVCSKYKHIKLNDEVCYIIPWGEAEDLRRRVHEVIESTQKGGTD